MWVVRLVLLSLLALLVGTSRYILKRRAAYSRLLENGAANLILVIVYNALCYLSVGLDSEPPLVHPPAFLTHLRVQRWVSVYGQVLMGLSALMMVAALLQRRALGGQDSAEGLLTTGIYRYVRHPIYTGIVWMALGFGLTSLNWEGLLAMPAILGLNVLQAYFEERYDVGVRFHVVGAQRHHPLLERLALRRHVA